MNRYEYYHLMDPISTWGGTYTAPNLFWYDFGATTSTSDVTNTNWIGPNGTYSFFRKAHDFTGNGYHLRNSLQPTYQLTVGYSSTNGKTLATIGSYTFSTSAPTQSVGTGILETYDKLINSITVSQSTTIWAIKSGVTTGANQAFLIKWSSATSSNHYGYYSTMTNNSSSSIGVILGGQTTSTLPNGNVTNGTSSLAKYQILCITQSGYNYLIPSKLLSNEVNITTSTSSSVLNTDGTIQIQLTGVMTYSALPEIMEIMTWKRVLTNQEISDVHSYLSAKWNINY